MNNQKLSTEEQVAWKHYESTCWSPKTTIYIVTGVLLVCLFADSVSNLF